ncbi:glycosyltransferase family 39 protein [Flavobacterium sp. RHBU_3]|uniref:glycosyltransferase family 39 protein n=1 Tax=Flavobacterium sp. RHBU_3 TaxID=3391184 RepID=UPI003984C275
MKKKIDKLLLPAIIILASFLRFFRLDYQSLWMDEIFTLNITDPSLNTKEFLNAIETTEGFPYLYYFFLRAFYTVAGYSAAVARIPSAIAGVLAIYVIYLLVKEIYNKQAGIIAALLLAINEFGIHYSQEARSYNLYLLATLFSFYRLSIFIKKPDFKTTMWYAISGILLLNLSFFGAINFFSQYVVLVVIYMYSANIERKKISRYGLIAGVISVAFFLPNYRILKKMFSVKSFWIGPPQQDSLKNIFCEIFGGFELEYFVILLLIIYYFVFLFRKGQEILDKTKIIKDQDVFSAILLSSWFVIFVLIMLIKSYIGPSLLISRYFISIVPVFIIVVAISISNINIKFLRNGVLSVLTLLICVNIVIIKKYYTSKFKSQYREVSQFIEKNNKDHSTVYTSLKGMFDFYLDNKELKTNLQETTLDNFIEAMAADSTKIKPFWYADAHVRPFNVSENNKEFLNKYFSLAENFEGYDAWTHYYVLNDGRIEEISSTKLEDLKKKESGITYNFDEFIDDGKELKASGWAFVKGHDATNFQVSIILMDPVRGIKLKTQQVMRNDVTVFMASPYNLDNSGFLCHLPLQDLPKANYKVGIYIKNKSDGSDYLVTTDKNVIVK